MDNILLSYLTDPLFAGSPSLSDRMEWVTVGNKRILAQIPTPTDKTLVPAKIGILAEFSRDNFSIAADMNWVGMDDPLHLCFGTGQLSRASDTLAAISWPGILDGLHRLQAKLPAEVLANTHGPIVDGKVNISHQYFMEIYGNDDNVGSLDVISGDLIYTSEHEDLFSLTNWPANTVDRRQSLIAMEDHFKVNPLPVFDNSGRLLHPCDYERYLKGAFVAMDIMLSHQVVANTGVGMVVAHIDRIEILRKPLRIEKSLTACRMPYDLSEANAHYNTLPGSCHGCSTRY
ncbi:hypothetical protein QCA50_013637 [Cerrena zonata]|uniref:Uncharacterized protein n=1 Tax=Cerrena zonata TaxID=2478898 RepID=A0AAW0FWV1_9APHY